MPEKPGDKDYGQRDGAPPPPDVSPKIRRPNQEPPQQPQGK